MNVSVSRYALGVVSLLIVCGSLGMAALTLRRHFLSDWIGAPARLAESVIGLALLIAILETLGLLHLFRLGPIVIASALSGLGSWQALGRPRGSRPRGVRAWASGPPQRLAPAAALAILTAGAVTAEWAAPTLQSYDVGIKTFDSLWYHLPWAASFAQTGNVTSLRFTDVEYLTAFYPATAELLHGLGIVLLARDTLSPVINLAWLWLALLAGWCIGRPRGIGPMTMLGTALALATPTMTASQAGSAANDIVGVFFLLASVALLVNASDERAPFVLAAIAAGLAAGVKLSLVAPVLALTIGAVAIAPRGRRSAAAALWLGPLLLAGGFWYLRNLVAVGNPLPWTSLGGILPTPAAPLQQHTAFAVAHYITDGHVVVHVFGPGLASGLGPWWPGLLAAAVIGPLLCVLKGADLTVRMLGYVALASLFAYLITPETAAGPVGQPSGFGFNLRYAAPALALSLAILPLAPALAGERRRAGTRLVLGALLVATLAQARLWPARHLLASLGVGAAAATVALLLELRSAAPRGVRGTRFAGGTLRAHTRLRARALALGLAVALLAAGGAAAYSWQGHYLRGRYAFQPGVSYLGRVWAFFRQVHGARVGLAGTFGGFFSYPLLGNDDSNRVQYIAGRGPHGSFTAIAACAPWRAAVNAGRYRYVVTTPARDPWRPKRLQPSPERGWIATDTAARVVFSRRATGQPITVFELRGPLDPAGCSVSVRSGPRRAKT